MRQSKVSVQLLLSLVLLGTHQVARAEFQIVLTTIQPSDGRPNTFMATSDQIASSLLPSGVPAIMWAIVKSGDVTAVCQHIVSTGSLNFDTTLTDQATGYTEEITFQIVATGGCEAAPDESGTEFVLQADNGRKSAIVCPNNAGSTGCAVYLTGDDVTAFYNNAVNQGSRRRLMGANSRNLLGCSAGPTAGGAVAGAVVGGFGGIYACGLFGEAFPFAIFCAAGAFVVFVGSGIMIGCAAGGCFPGDASVETCNGELKLMSDLQLGDKVAVWTSSGDLGCEDIYAFGHKDAKTTSQFIKLTMSSLMDSNTSKWASLELSASHFAPVISRSGNGVIIYKRGQDIQVGDLLWASPGIVENSKGLDHRALALHVVTGISMVRKRGLYNPYTLSGTILVDGVAASVHSDWFLDGLFDALNSTKFLPWAYQTVLATPRMLYRIMGKNVYITLYTWLDSRLNLVEVLYLHSSSALSAVILVALLLVPLLRLTPKNKTQM